MRGRLTNVPHRGIMTLKVALLRNGRQFEFCVFVWGDKMEEWVNLNQVFVTMEKAQKVANAIIVTESRLSSSPSGPQYDIETEITQVSDGWRVRWRKIQVDFDGGCQGCGACSIEENRIKQETRMGTVIQFRPRHE